MELTAEQAGYASEILSILFERGTALLAGYAGTGKTTTTAHVVRELRRAGKAVVVCAPTHRAAAVLGSRLPGVEAYTLHAALGLYMYRAADGQMVTRAGAVGPADVADVLVVDEVSMLSPALWSLVRTAARGKGLLLVGDPAQLPPVDTGEASPVWTEVQAQYRLTRIMRQDEGSRILPLTALVRERLEAGQPVTLPELAGFVGPDVAVVSADLDTVATWVHDSDEGTRLLSYTNPRVDRANAVAHMRSGRTRIGTGDRVFFGAPYFAERDDERRVVVANGREAVVEGESDHTAELGGVPVRFLRVAGQVLPVPLDPEGHRRRTKVLADRVRVAARNNDPDRGQMLARLEVWQEDIADLRLGYAITVHRSQGSTYGTVFLDWKSLPWRDPVLACRLLYVAATRPARRLCVFA